MSTSAGLRELKYNARSLVQRAANGEHIIITRYGKPLAELGPAPALSGPLPLPRSPREQLFDQERAAFERLEPELVKKKLRGKWVAVLDGQVVASHKKLEHVYASVRKKHPGRTFYAAQVGVPPQIVELPSFEIER